MQYSSMSSVNSWGSSEWLISYSGGFVRRGLGGEIIYKISSLFEISPSIIIVFISVLSFLLLCAILIKISNNVIPTYILLSPIVLGMPVYSNFLIRKDVLGILFLIISLLVLKRSTSIISQLLVNIISIFAILNHETFIFYGIPLIMLTFNMINQKKIWEPSVIIRFLPTILVFFLVVIFHGTTKISAEIIETWNYLINRNYSECCILKEAPGIKAIGDVISSSMSLSKSVLSSWSGGVLYVPLMWLITLCISILILGQLAIKNQSIRSTFYVLVLIQSIFIFPLFIIGWDFGRWIFFILVSTISWVLIFKDDLINIQKFSVLNFNNINFVFNTKTKILVVMLFFSIPQCCWTWKGYLNRTPFFMNYNIYSQELFGYNLKEQYNIIIKLIDVHNF